ncbi:hypothetical protein GOV08_00570 [Candidatus Woesearchaeota archaeon]|nr:hypothetical protein [Candidatus Woesearchaeota archaeon]
MNVKEKNWGDLGKLSVSNHSIGKPQILFSKIEDDRIKELKEEFAGTKESDFNKLNLKVAKVLDVKKHPDADKLLILQVDLGKEKRQLVAGIAQNYTEKEILGKKIIVLANLEHAKLRGEKSEGMLLAAVKGDDVGVLFAKKANPGDQVLIEGAKPGKKTLSFKEFLKIKLLAKEGFAYYENKQFHVVGEKVKVDKIKNGTIS